MTKINKEEYKVLKGLDNMWKWIAREEDRGLYAFTKKPVKKSGKISPSYWDAGAEWSHPVFELIDEIHLFQFIQWTDEEPHNIQELIDEYEEYLRTPVTPKFSINGVEHLFENESEETEVKKQELIKNIKFLARETSQQWPHEEMVELPDVLREIDQLDELNPPNSTGLELPVIPIYVADFFIEVFGSERADHPESNTVYNFISNFKGGYGLGDEGKVRKWYFRNIENKQKFEKAWLLKDWIVDNRKYRIKFGKEKYGVRFDKKKLHATLFEKEKSSVFTEDEIFELEQGRLFWRNFAVPVEELEE